MKPYYEEAGIVIYHGDCRDVLPDLSPADLILTDVPYGVVSRDSGGLRLLKKGAADVADMTGFEIANLLAPAVAGSAYVFCGTEQVSGIRHGFVDEGLTTRLGIWEKSDPSPMNGEVIWLSSVECCVFARRPRAYFAERCASPVWRGPVDHEYWGCETPKPRWLFDRLVLASCPPSGLVLDPFMGGGTALASAKNLSRRAIGIDRREVMCELAVKRLAQCVLDFGGAA